MSRDTDNSLFINFSLPRFYQQLLSGIVSYQELGNRIIRKIKAAQAFRATEVISELAGVLINLPIKEYQLIGQYYLVWCDSRKPGFQPEALEQIIEQTQTHKSQALSTRAAFEVFSGEMGNAIYFYTEALKTSRTVSEQVSARVAIAMVKSLEGFHQSSLKDMQVVLPLIRYVQPALFFNFHNSYATELAEAGQKQEARNISRIVLASPFAPAYPEWQETARELKEPDHSFVAAPSIEPEPVEIETIEAHQASEPEQHATVLAFPALKEAPQPERPDRLTPQEISELTVSEKRELVLAAIRTNTLNEFDYDKLIIMVGLLEVGPADKILDLEDEETLNDIAVIWAHQVKPDELAAVLSAIRDCEDRERQKNILDRMIRIVFEETQLCGLTEEAWRLEVERRLPKK